MAVTKSLFPTVVPATAHRKMRGVRMDVAKIAGVASLAVTNSAATIAVVKVVVAMKVAPAITVAVRQALDINVADHPLPAANPEATAPMVRGARAITAQSQQALVGIRML